MLADYPPQPAHNRTPALADTPQARRSFLRVTLPFLLVPLMTTAKNAPFIIPSATPHANKKKNGQHPHPSLSGLRRPPVCEKRSILGIGLSGIVNSGRRLPTGRVNT